MLRFFIFSAFLPLFIPAQRIANLNLFSTGSYVGLKFTITKGAACSGYTIYHSTDSLNFSHVYEYLGVCGNSPADEQKDFTHTAPAHGRVNYYRVKLQPIETSKIVRIFVPDPAGPELLLYPNPLYEKTGDLTLRLLSTSHATLQGAIYDQYGKQLRNLKLDVINNQTSLSVSELNNGLYFLRLNDGVRNYTTTFNILR